MNDQKRWKSTDAAFFVVGCILGEDLLAARLAVPSADPPTLLQAGRFSWIPSGAIGDPFERHLEWSVSEPVIIAVPTPRFVGGSLSLRWRQPGEREKPADERTHARRQERALQAAWETRERVRERAARFFDCPLADVQLLTEDLGAWQVNAENETIEGTALFVSPLEERRGFSAQPPDVPECHLVLLPLLASELLPDDSAGLLCIEEGHSSFVLRQGTRLGHAQSIPLGGRDLVARTQRALSCSPSEARAVLTRCENGVLSPESTRAIGRILRPLVPLFRAGVELLAEEAVRAGTVRSLHVTGVWPSVMQRFLLGPHATLTGPKGPVVTQLLTLPELRSSAAVGSQAPDAGRALLLLLAAAVAHRVLPAVGATPTGAVPQAQVHVR